MWGIRYPSGSRETRAHHEEGCPVYSYKNIPELKFCKKALESIIARDAAVLEVCSRKLKDEP